MGLRALIDTHQTNIVFRTFPPLQPLGRARRSFQMRHSQKQCGKRLINDMFVSCHTRRMQLDIKIRQSSICVMRRILEHKLATQSFLCCQMET